MCMGEFSKCCFSIASLPLLFFARWVKHAKNHKYITKPFHIADIKIDVFLDSIGNINPPLLNFLQKNFFDRVPKPPITICLPNFPIDDQ
jgi:hypothetical protein